MVIVTTDFILDQDFKCLYVSDGINVCSMDRDHSDHWSSVERSPSTHNSAHDSSYVCHVQQSNTTYDHCSDNIVSY